MSSAMANFKFEGELAGISARHLEFVSSVLQDRGFDNGKVVISPVGKAGDGFVANVKRFSIEQNGETFKMVAKIAPTNEMQRAQMNSPIAFRNEHVMYTEVLPKLTEIEKGADIPEKERLRYAICYGSIIEAPNEIILLEDLNESNFQMMDRLQSLSDESIKLVLKSFAKLHSLSYALKNQEPETYEVFTNKLMNIWLLLSNMQEFKAIFTAMENNIITILDNENHKKYVKGVLTDLITNVVKQSKIDKGSRYSVIQQGDSWTNNILFRLEGEKSVECCMIDYQLSKESTPVADLHYMIFNCTDYETRAKHYYEWIDYYHSELDKCLANHGLKSNYVYPRDQLDADLKRFGKLSLRLSLTLASMMMSEVNEAAKFKEAMQANISLDEMLQVADLSNVSNPTQGRIKARVEGLINSYIELGYL